MSGDRTFFGYLGSYRLEKVEMGSVLRGIASGYSCGRCLEVLEDKNMHALIEDRETPCQNLDFGISIKIGHIWVCL